MNPIDTHASITSYRTGHLISNYNQTKKEKQLTSKEVSSGSPIGLRGFRLLTPPPSISFAAKGCTQKGQEM
jgi:hypothetical protein